MRTLACIVLMFQILIYGQSKDKWERIYTGEGYVIEMKVSRVVFGIGSSGRVEFRTVFSKPATLKEVAGAAYKSRLEKIEFRCAAKTYRVAEATLLDANDQTIQSYEAKISQDWKVLKTGGMMERLFIPACRLIGEKRRNP